MRKNYDVIECMFNGICLVPIKTVHKNLTREEAESYLPEGADDRVASEYGEKHLLTAISGSYKLTK